MNIRRKCLPKVHHLKSVLSIVFHRLTRLEIGPKTFFKQDNETISVGPEKMISIPPRHYCIVENPIMKNETGEVQFDENGQVRLSHANLDIRLDKDYKDPFQLYPGEILRQVR